MALMPELSPLAEFLGNLSRGAPPRHWLAQLGALAAAGALGWYLAHSLCKRVRPSPRWKFGEGDFERVAIPLFAYGLVVLAKAALGRYQAVALMDIAASLLLAWIAIRIAVYILGHVLPPGGVLRGLVRIVAWMAWIAVALHLTGLLGEVLHTLEDIGFSPGKDRDPITLLLILKAVGALALAIMLALWVSRIAESRVIAVEGVEMSSRMVVAKVVRVATIFAAILVALPAVGIDITALSVFSGALGVGLGFGLQKIASNYVSGFIVLLDRSLRIGDIVTVGPTRGEVKAIESRYTVLRALDGTEAIIPNETLITTPVIHHTYTDPKVMLSFEVAVAYESNVERACELLVAIAHHHPRLVEDPPAVARVRKLAESGVDLQLVAWIKDPAEGEGELRSEVLKEILRVFRAEGIRIPYPQRDVRLLATDGTEKSPSLSGI